MATEYSYIDLFAGCGGLSLGLYNAGWKGLFAVEKNLDAFSTLKHNLIEKKQHFNWPTWLPKQNLEIDDLLQKYKEQLISLRGKVDLVTGGPPCQGFSTAGLRREDDLRNKLIDSYLKFIEYTQPKFIFFENVKGFTLEFKKNKSQNRQLAKNKGEAYSNYVLNTLEGLGYRVKGKMVDFSKFGVPQKRTRFILFGIKKDIARSKKLNKNSFFKEILLNRKSFLLDKALPLQPKLVDAISDLLKGNGLVQTPDRGKKFFSGLYGVIQSPYQIYLRSGATCDFPNSHSFPNHKLDTIEKFKIFLGAPKGKNISPAFKKALAINKHVIIPLAAKKPSPTVTTLPDDHIHYDEPRILTVREYARIQSFPDWYEFKGVYTTGGPKRTKEVPRYTQVGNAIPPLFGEQAGLAINKLINA